MDIFIDGLNLFIIFNLLLAFLYLISRAAGDWLSEGISHTDCFAHLIGLILVGLTILIASLIYDTFNWFVARLVLVVYISGLIVIMVVLP